ncbi:MAG: hypothetical protein ABI992_07485 [Chthoniobacterales bacterium]
MGAKSRFAWLLNLGVGYEVVGDSRDGLSGMVNYVALMKAFLVTRKDPAKAAAPLSI